MSTVLSPSRTDSSTPITTTICGVFQLSGLKTKVVVARFTSATSGLVIKIVTSAEGLRSSCTEKEAVTVPDSLTTIIPAGETE